MFKRLAVVVSTLVLHACSSNPIPSNAMPVFQTRISPSGLKHFELRYQMAREPGAERPNQGRSRDGRSGRQSNPAKMYENTRKQMTAQAERMIEENRYCRTGFWVLNFEMNRSPRLRGECHEIATEQDRERFPDTIQNW